MGLLDLDPGSRDELQFDELLAWIAAHARTAGGRQQLIHSEPAADAREVSAELDAVEEVRRYLIRHGKLLAASLPEITTALERLPVAGVALEPKPLLDLARVARTAGELGRSLGALDAADAGWSQLIAERSKLPDLSRESEPVLRGIDPEGRILDEASSELRRIRSLKFKVSERLQSRLRELLHDPGTEPVIRDDFITQRNGRYVIPVRTDAPFPLPGIVHARSSSGATHFVEPLESVEMNNDLVRLDEEEQAEQQRVLLVWSEAFRRRLADVRALLRVLERIDTLQARALFAEEVGAAITRVEPDGPLQLCAVRHPLLERHLNEEGGRIVPLDLNLDPADRVLVLSGPNTGGKTVALKTLGLSVLMAQSGIPVPAAVARLPLFGQLRADIGDHQSIQSDLSTYSAHVTAIGSFLRRMQPPAVFLFDEIGTGTEPGEGAALAQSVLEELLRPGMTVVATTHQGALKAWAFTSERAVCAAMEFDRDSLRPTYRILMETAGTSAGLDIAQRLGLPATVILRARELMDPDSLRAEGFLQRLRELMARREDEISELTRREEALEQRTQELEARAESDRQTHAREASAALDRALKDWKRLASELLTTIEERQERERVSRELARADRRLHIELVGHRARLGHEAQGAGPPALVGDPLPDMRVHVASLGRDGIVQQLRGTQIDVRFGDVVFSVHRDDLRQPGAVTPQSGASPRPRGPAAAHENRSVAREIRLIGMQVEPALEALDRYLDDALLSGHDEVRVVHGHGTGKLRSAVRKFLRAHAQVAGFRPGEAGEGGEGATVVRLH